MQLQGQYGPHKIQYLNGISVNKQGISTTIFCTNSEPVASVPTRFFRIERFPIPIPQLNLYVQAMHTLNFNRVFADFNPGRKCYGPTECDSLIGRVGSMPVGRRKCWIAACVPERNGAGGESKSPSASSLFSRSQTYALLKQQMEVAAKSEDYEEAARIRDSLRTFEEEEPVLRLRRLIKEAIADERFEDAAKYRDELKEIAPSALLKCSSDATTLGIRVQVRSVYIEGRSHPAKGQYFFAYRIRITNNSDRPVQLLRRHWIITDANGKTENFWGVGVIGEQPVILPQTGFEYSSACPLMTPNGRMEGDFEMKHIDKVGSKTFNVAIAPFSLSTLGDDSEIF